MVGLWNTFFGFILFCCLKEFLLQGQHQLNLLLTFIISTPQAHFSQRKLVWKSEEVYIYELGKYIISSLSLYAINVVLLEVFFKGLGLPLILSQLVSIALIIILTYVSHSRFVFALRREGRAS